MVALLSAVLVVFTGCGGGPPRGFDRLWVDDWSWHHRGTDWILGVAAGEYELTVGGHGAALRCELMGLDGSGGTVSVAGTGSTSTLRVGALERRFVSLELAAGEYTVAVPPGVAVGSPRLGLPRSGARWLVFVLVDTLRADHVRGDLTPGIVSRFSDGRRWHQATANSSWTVPSVASLFTSRPVLAISTPDGDTIGVPKGIVSWPSLLDGAGFVGAAVVANYTVHVQNGFAAGFSTYLVPDGHGRAPHPDASWTVEEGRRWLRAHRGEDAFLYLHLMDPHQPYRSHSANDPQAPNLEPLATRRRRATAGEEALLQRLYAGEVEHVDRILSPFLAELPDDAVVVFTSDHGEALGEHGAWGHGLNLYQEAVRVPLLIRGPGVVEGDVDRPVQLLDLGPTVLDLMGVAGGNALEGRSLLAGGSTAPLVSTTFGGGPLRWAWRRDRDKLVLRMAAQPGIGAESRSAMIEGDPLPSGAFHFDLAADPNELAPGRVPDELLPAAGRAFATTAGRMVPGLQLLLWGRRGPSTGAIGVAGSVDIVQAWSVAPMTVRRAGERVEIACIDGFPVCAVAASVEPRPESVEVEEEPGAPHRSLPIDRLPPPEGDLPPGGYLWWNPARTVVVEGYEETIERLRALGYIE